MTDSTCSTKDDCQETFRNALRAEIHHAKHHAPPWESEDNYPRAPSERE
jgi:hypothetical protein